jgi:hypothetical protein
MGKVTFAAVPLFVLAGIAGAVMPAAGQGGGSQGVVKTVARRAAPSVPAADFAAIRAATEKYVDVKAALADGYIRDPSDHCITSDMEGAPRQLGAMGVHYIRPDLLGITGVQPRVNGTGMHVDFLKPSVLMYEPQADGSQKLVGIENLVWAKAWKDGGNKEAPSFNGFDYYYMHDNPSTEADEAHGFEPHYELHFWLYRDNPNGMFAPFNAAVSCEHHSGH